MRILVVEDEPNTRNGIIKIIETYTGHQVMGGASDGETGLLEALRLQPDVVITDINMPQMNGLVMIERMRKEGCEAAAVVLTGYSEFEYAQKAIQLSVVEYLLKPLSVEDIMSVLETVENRLSKTRAKTVSPQQLLFSLLTGESKEEAMRQFVSEIRYQNGQEISLFLIQSESILEDTTKQMAELLKDSLETNCLTSFYTFLLPYERQILVMILDGQSVRYLKNLFQTRILKELKEKGEFLISFESIYGIGELKDVIRQMQDSLSYSFLFSESCIMDQELIKKLVFERIDYPEYLEHGVKREIKNGNQDGIRRMAGLFEEQVILRREQPETIKNHTVRFVMAILDTARELMKEKDIDGLYQYLLNDMMKTGIREVFLNNYWKIIGMVTDGRDSGALTDNGMILNVIGFIRQNYAREISLTDAAELVGITPEYLSKLFTKEMGINFTAFLGEFRISTAKKLLASGKYKIYEVAELVGFKDTKYFNKVFRSIAGVCPSDYRKGV